MAENIVLDFTSDNKDLQDTIKKLEQIGIIDKKNAEQFRLNNNANAASSKARLDNLQKETLLLQDLQAKSKKAFDADSIRAYGDDIKRAKDNIAALKGEVDKTGNSMGSLTSTLKNVAAAIGITFGIQQIVSFGKEAVLLAAKGEGIRQAFAKIGDDKALEKLRIATRGAVSDLDLMSKTLQAKNLGVPTELFAKSLKFAGQIARQTGQDVNYLVESIVGGLGRNSLRLLDNVGVSMKEIKDQMKAAGQTTQEAFGAIIQARMEKQGEVLETNADKIARLSAGWDNFKEKAGVAIIDSIGFLSDFEDAVDHAALKLGSKLGISDTGREKIAKDAEEARTKAFEDGAAKRKAASIEESKAEIETFKQSLREIASERNKDNFTKKQLDDAELSDKKNLADAERQLNHLLGKDIVKAKHILTEEEEKEAEKAAKALAELKKRNRDREIDAQKSGLAEGLKIAEQFRKAELEALKLSNEARVLATEKGSDERLAAEIDGIQSISDFLISDTDLTEQERLNIIKQSENDILAIRTKAQEDFEDLKAKGDHEEFERQKKKRDDEKKSAEELHEAKIDLELQGLDAITEINDIATEHKLRSLQTQLKYGVITQEEFDKKEREIKRKAANRDKLLSLFKIGINTAEAISKSVAVSPATFGLPFSAFAAISGAIQAGLVAAQPIPFAKGTKAVKGGQAGKDSVHALLMPDEMVVPVGTKKKYQPILNAIFDEKISPDLLNSLVNKNNMAIGGGSNISKYDIKEGMTSALRNGIMVKNMPQYERGLTVDDLRFLTRRGLA